MREKKHYNKDVEIAITYPVSADQIEQQKLNDKQRELNEEQEELIKELKKIIKDKKKGK